MKAIAVLLWVLLVTFVTVVLWPTEAGSIRELWASANPSLLGFGVATNVTSPPLWFVALGVLLFAVIYTVPGLTFSYAKARFDHMHELWRLRKEALRLLEDADRTSQLSNHSRNALDVAEYFLNDALRQAATETIGAAIHQAYDDAIRARIQTAKTQLNGSRALSNQERHECEEVVRIGQVRLVASTATTI